MRHWFVMTKASVRVMGWTTGLLVATACGGATVALAQERLSTSGRAALFESQKKLLDDRAASQYNSSVRLQPPRAVVPTVYGGPRYSGDYAGPFLRVARDAARRHGIPEDLFLRLVQQESGWNAAAVSPKGAIGLAQLMPATARALRVNPNDPSQNLDGGARYLAEQFKVFQSWRLALAAYNAGPNAVTRFGGVPPYRETQAYVRAILGS